MRVKGTRNWRIGATIGCLMMCLSGDRANANQQQLRALLAKHFISSHQAIPLNNNGKVRSGDVLKLPEEATYLSREKCYRLPPITYSSINAESIRATSDIAAEVGGQIPTEKIAEIEAELKGKLSRTDTLLLDPLSQEEPLKGYADLVKPASGATECAVISDILSGRTQDKVLVTAVFYGALNAVSTIDVAGGIDASASIKQRRLNEILGGTPKVLLKASGSSLRAEFSRSPEPQSLAVQSAFVNLDKLAKIYLAYHTRKDGIELERLVYEYVTGTKPGLLDTLRIAINKLLEQMELRFASAAALYQAVLTGKEVGPATKVSKEGWKAVATVAAAHEIVGTR